jgi:hypothetical protein
MLSDRARGVVKPHGLRSGIIHLGHYNVGKTERCAFARALLRAKEQARQLNNIAPEALPGEVMTFGGSA